MSGSTIGAQLDRPSTTVPDTTTIVTGVSESNELGRSRAANELKRKTVRGALVSISSQAASLLLRTGSVVIMARLLVPDDFGVVGMVTAVTGFLSLFRDCGLSMATVQRQSVTHA